jgi:hypothetical protein
MLTESIPLNRFMGSLNVYRFGLSLAISNTTEYSERQRPLSGLHSIVMEKLAQAGG